MIFKKGIFLAALALSLMLGSVTAVEAAATGAVGYVDFLYLINQHPDTAQANATLQASREAAKAEFEQKAAILNDADWQALDRQLGQQLEQKRLELVKPISEKVIAAADQVAKEEGLSIVIGKDGVICGGIDITADVLKKISGK